MKSSAKGCATGPKTIKGEGMTHFLVAIHPPDDFDPSIQDKAMERDIDALNEEMEAKGVRLFAGGLGEVAANSARCQGAYHPRAIPGDEGARGRFLDTGSR